MLWLEFERLLPRAHHYHLSAEGDENPGGGVGDPPAAAGEGNGVDDGGGAPPKLSSLADPGAEATTPADWPEDWRERFAGKNDGFGKLLKRFSSPENFAKTYTELQKKLATAPTVPTLPENPTDEQVAEYRKAAGIPETPDGYGAQFPAEFQATAADQALLKSYLDFAHERNLPPGQVKASVEWQAREILRARQEYAAETKRENARVTQRLKQEYGAEAQRNLGLVDEFIESHPGIARYIPTDRLDLDLTKDLVALARAIAPDDALYGGDGASGGKSLDEKINELTQKNVRVGLSPEESAERLRLINLRSARDERRANQSNRAA